jgi:hypothetical protein
MPDPVSGLGAEDRPLTMDDLPPFTGWTLNELEAHVAGKFLTEEVRRYLGSAWRVVSTSNGVFSPDGPDSACAGFISLEPAPQAAIDLGCELAKEYGW